MINRLSYKVGSDADGYVNKLIWGYNTCSVINAKEIQPYSLILDRESLRGRYGERCICPEIMEHLTSKVNYFAGKEKLDLSEFKNTSGYNFWAYTNSDCIPQTHYQKWCKQFLCDLSVVIALKKGEDCDIKLLTFLEKKPTCDIDVKSIKVLVDRICKLDVSATINEYGCALGAEVFLVKNFCDIGADFQIDENTCNLAHEAYVQNFACDITLSTFKTATQNFHNC